MIDETIILALSGSGVLGGGETYIIRMIKWLKQNGYRVMIMHQINADFDKYVDNIFNELGVERILIPTMKFNPSLMDFTKADVKFPDGSKIRIICIQASYNFFAAQTIKRKLKNCDVQVFHYMIHENDYCRNLTNNTQNGLVRAFFKTVYSSIVKKMEKNYNAVFMTESYHDNIHKNLEIENGGDYQIVRLGINVEPYDEKLAEKRAQNKDFTIISAARLDFPTKGFIVGLVDEFAAACEHHNNLKLTIIGDGDGKTSLIEKIESMPSDIKDKINLIGQVSYEGLMKYYKTSSLFVGAGTGPLDASNCGLLSVVANINEMTCNCSGYFYEDITNMGYGGKKAAREIIDAAASLSSDEYLKTAKKNYMCFADTYSIEVSMKKLLSLKNKNKSVLFGRTFLLLTKCVRFFIDVLLKLKKHGSGE